MYAFPHVSTVLQNCLHVSMYICIDVSIHVYIYIYTHNSKYTIIQHHTVTDPKPETIEQRTSKLPSRFSILFSLSSTP